MRTIIEDDVFSNKDIRIMSWVALFYQLETRGHGLVMNTNGTEFVHWENNLDKVVRQELRESIHICLEREGLHPSSVEYVLSNESNSVDQALVVTAQPAAIFLEDDKDDWHFLLATALPEQRSVLLQAKNNGLLEILHGGGVGGVKARGEQKVKEQITAGYVSGRVFAMLDSDSLYPGHEDPTISQAKSQCESTLGPHRTLVLSRRSIENYLPDRAFEDWLDSHTGGGTPAERQLRVESLIRLGQHSKTIILRHHHNMKQGINGDKKRIKIQLSQRKISPDAVVTDPTNPEESIILGYESLATSDLESLRHGFGDKIANHYTNQSSWYIDNIDWCEEDVRRETKPFIAHILRCL